MTTEEIDMMREVDTFLTFRDTEVSKCANAIMRYIGSRDLAPVWSGKLVKEMRKVGYSKSVIYRAINRLAVFGVIDVLYNHWGNAISANMSLIWKREIWWGFIIPF